MKLKKFILMGCAILLLTAGCGKKVLDEPGIVSELSYSQLQEKMDNKETFVMVFTQTTCTHCVTFKKMLDEEYLPYYDVEMFDFVLDHQSGERSELTKNLEVSFPNFTGTPDVYYIENGVVKERFWDVKDELSEEQFHDWMKNKDLEK